MMTSDHLNNTQNLVHPEWELKDPKPAIHVLFAILDQKFFEGKLSKVKLGWSEILCHVTGICYQRKSPVDGSRCCTIWLSKPLLELRTRKDLVETLLHQMVHADLFLNKKLTTTRHGPIFEEKMHEINQKAGTNITVSLSS